MSAEKLIRQLGCIVGAGFVTAFLIGTVFNSRAIADTKQGEKLYNNNCASCHASGKNSIDPKKPVTGSKKLSSKAVFKSFLEVQNGMMPPFKAIAAKDEALTSLYDYAKSLK